MTQSLPFVHTARRYYRLGVPVRALDWRPLPSGKRIRRKEVRTGALRGSKSRNKVSVGEPAEGSLLDIANAKNYVEDESSTTLWKLLLFIVATQASPSSRPVLTM